MSKNAYEIRLQILLQATELLKDAYNNKHNLEMDNWYKKMDQKDAVYEPLTISATFPTTEEIITKAEALYKFVEKE